MNESKENKEQKIDIESNQEFVSKNILNKSEMSEISETSQIKPIKNICEFQFHLIEAYKHISGFYQNPLNANIIKDKNIGKNNNQNNIQLCENELRIALDKLNESPKIELNKNILDKISRIIHHNKINTLLILGKIFMNLIIREKLFDSEDKNLDINTVIFFINEIYYLNSILKETYLGNKLNQESIKFIEKIINDFKFEKDQFIALKNLIDLQSEKHKQNKLNLNSLEEMILSINDLEQSQDNYYMQYQIIINNFDYIIGMINQTDVNDRSNLSNYIELGKIFAYLLYNKKYVLFMKGQKSESDPQGVIKLLFDGSEDNYLLNVVEGEKYYIDYDYEIEQMREKLSDLIIKYVEKYKSITNIFEFQYVLYVLIKRVYFLYYEKNKSKVEPILAEIMVNLCFYKVDNIEEIKIFIHEILNSEDPKNNNLKNLLTRKIDFVKMNPNFQYKHIEKNENNDNNYFTSIENISNESILLLESDLKLGYFLVKKINSGDKFTFYVELTEPYGLIDFCVNIEEYNIKLTILNLTESKVILSPSEINSISSPFKMSMFFTKPIICKFELDNSYSWIRSKTIKYKVNIFYPQEPFYIGRQILLYKYQEALFSNKNENKKSNSSKNMLIVKFNGQNKAFNCIEVMKNLEILDKLIKDNFISIHSIFIKKDCDNDNNNISYFYYINNNGELVQVELTKNNFIDYIQSSILKTSNTEIDIVNLYIISGDSNIIDSHYISLEEILGFVPDIKLESADGYNNYKILFFMQYLHQAQLIYSLYLNLLNKQSYDIVLLINYTKYGGYQICLYKNGVISINPKNYIKVNKKESFEKNIDLIVEETKKFGDERRIDILVCESIDSNDKEYDAEKICELFKKKLKIEDEDESDYKIVKMSKEFNHEIFCNSHIFYC